jgi:hypothetical protein
MTEEQKEAFRRLDEAIGALGRASTETQISHQERWDAAKTVRDYLFELRGRMQEVTGDDVSGAPKP